ncbi:MAG: S8 family serine peptidase [Deltaproteobacteria bacterium]|nr:S8 family serine peptidase [Deltaproteobacteria bacterium]
MTRHRLLLSLLFLLTTGSAGAQAPTKLDPLLNLAAEAPVDAVAMGKAVGVKAALDGTPIADALIKATDPAELTKIIEQWGGRVRTVAGAILTADLPVAYLRDLAALDLVVYIEAAKPMRAKLDASRAVVNIDDVQNGTGLSQAYKGSGVIVGVVDSGIDCQHADFKDASGSTRILAYWDQVLSGSGVAEISGSSGKEYTSAALSDGTCANSPDDKDQGAHGTHVAGILASKHGTYTGVAPEAQIVAVRYGSQDADSGGSLSTTIVDAVNYIFRKAQSKSPKMPVVANLSIGTSIGAHDDTSLFEQGLNALLKSGSDEKQGRAIVGAAGNENFRSSDSEAASFGGIHATIDQTGASKAFDFFLRSNGALPALVDIWLTATSSCSIQLDAYPKSSKTTPVIDMTAVEKDGSTGSNSNTDTKLQLSLDFTDSNNANNGKQHAVARISQVDGSSVTATQYSFDLIFLGTCSGDAWLYPDQTSLLSFRKASALPVSSNTRGYTYVDGDSNKTMTIPATASGVIAVGSFVGRCAWTDVNGTSHNQCSVSEGFGGTLGGISTFSSLGPTADGRIKPDITAPGEPIISTLASNYDPGSSSKGDPTHQKLAGTSQAAPHVAGTVALMLQRNGCLKPTDIKNFLKNNAASDSNTGSGLPNNTWGAGKLDALKATAAVTAASCAPDNPSDEGAGSSYVTTTSTTDGGGGCSLIRPAARF